MKPIINRPTSINVGITFLYVKIIILILSCSLITFMVSQTHRYDKEYLILTSVGTSLISILGYLLIIYKLKRGKSWVRTLFLLIVLLNTIFANTEKTVCFEILPLLQGVFVISIFCTIAIVKFLYSSSSSLWFDSLQNTNSEKNSIISDNNDLNELEDENKILKDKINELEKKLSS